jgi:lysophospholipase L1-like esterase
LDLRITNRGISGNRVYDLESRLQADVVDLKATVVSVMIGINDTWRRYDSKVPSPIPEFEASYRRILQTIVQKLSARLVICEPFLLPIPPDRVAWREDLDPRIAAVRRLAVEFQATFVPLDGVFAAAACRQEMDYWLPDGVHPTPAGHALIAEEWLAAVTLR